MCVTLLLFHVCVAGFMCDKMAWGRVVRRIVSCILRAEARVWKIDRGAEERSRR